MTREFRIIGTTILVFFSAFTARAANATANSTNDAANIQTTNIQTTTATTTALATPDQFSRWSFEADLQAHSVSGDASPWLGISFEYRWFNALNIGLRGFVPFSHTVDDATYAIQGFGRLRMVHGKSTDVFSELDVAENFYDFTPFTSYGLAVGTLTKITPNFSVGVTGGIELATEVIDSIGLEDEPNLVVYPKIGLIANFNL